MRARAAALAVTAALFAASGQCAQHGAAQPALLHYSVLARSPHPVMQALARQENAWSLEPVHGLIDDVVGMERFLVMDANAQVKVLTAVGEAASKRMEENATLLLASPPERSHTIAVFLFRYRAYLSQEKAAALERLQAALVERSLNATAEALGQTVEESETPVASLRRLSPLPVLSPAPTLATRALGRRLPVELSPFRSRAVSKPGRAEAFKEPAALAAVIAGFAPAAYGWLFAVSELFLGVSRGGEFAAFSAAIGLPLVAAGYRYIASSPMTQSELLKALGAIAGVAAAVVWWMALLSFESSLTVAKTAMLIAYGALIPAASYVAARLLFGSGGAGRMTLAGYVTGLALTVMGLYFGVPTLVGLSVMTGFLAAYALKKPAAKAQELS